MSLIVQDNAIRSGDPRVEGTRVTVLDMKRRVIDGEEDPHVVAGEYGISMVDLFGALRYDYEHRDALKKRERDTERARHIGERQTRELVDKLRGEDATRTNKEAE